MCVTADVIYVFYKSVMNISTKIRVVLLDYPYFALLRKVEPAIRCGELGALPPRLDRETVRWTVSLLRGKSCHDDENKSVLTIEAAGAKIGIATED